MKPRTLGQDVAQMVMPRINGRELSDPARRADLIGLVKEGIGGFILFGGDIETTPLYLNELQSHAEVPLLISSDVERGLGQQLEGGTRFPSQRAVASAIGRRSRRDEQLLNRMLDAVRLETRAAGIHAVFSPVMDVNNNPGNPIICTRAFGEEPETVEWFGARYIRRLQRPARDGMLELLACAKHYPGHGDTDQDSHSVLPVIRAERSRLNSVELPPFREAVKDGVGMIMVAHLLVPALDPEKPTTFSKKTVTALLREGMEFEGLIVSDALDMGALSGTYSQEEIAVSAVHAGMDILLHPADARKTIEAVVSAVERGRITRARIRESVGRIFAAKERLGLLVHNLSAPAGSTKEQRRTPAKKRVRRPSARGIDYAKHRGIARELGRRALKVIAGDRKLLPLDAAKGAACFVMDDDTVEGAGAVLLSGIMGRFSSFTGTVLTPSAAFSRDHALNALAPVAAVVVAFFSKISASKGRSGIAPSLDDAAGEILGLAKSLGKKTIVISFDSPYILDRFRDTDLRIAAFDRMGEIQRAVAEMITGNSGVL